MSSTTFHLCLYRASARSPWQLNPVLTLVRALVVLLELVPHPQGRAVVGVKHDWCLHGEWRHFLKGRLPQAGHPSPSFALVSPSLCEAHQGMHR